MSGRKTNATGRSRGGDRFIALPHYMLKCLAWRMLSSDAKAIYIDVWLRHDGQNNGHISYAVREAEAIGIPRSRAARAFGELTDHGFLQVVKQSSFTTKNRAARTWKLATEKAGEEPASKEFMRWSAAHSQSHQRDCEAGRKFRTQSRQRDAQSHQRDCDPNLGNDITSDSPTSGTVSAISALSQSHQRDTYNLPSTLSEAAAPPRDEKPKLALASPSISQIDPDEYDFESEDDEAA